METIARLQKLSVSARKTRYVINVIRNKPIDEALVVLKHCVKTVAKPISKLLLSCISNWKHKNKNDLIKNNELYITQAKVDGATMLKRMKPAPQGRSHRIRKRSCHITIYIDKITSEENKEKTTQNNK